ncbi:hypothetical protein Godav_005160 [Gossypium davidsonii]|uniref:Uncharacterized protein n=1 Tax=Gossypium davidsonii TaxID=34287 RepID=A0A7J8TGF9_GOSDV|nr:hypothetical protein [Gossypium davidsonii]
MKKRVDVFALSIYGLVIFPKALGHIDEAVSDLFDRLNKRVEDVEWRVSWMIPDDILYWCGDFDWVPLLGIWGAIGFAPLLDFEKMSLELGRKIEQLEEEKMRLGLDVDIQKLEAKKLRKENNKTEEHLDSLKTDYKKLRLSIRTASLGKTSEQWWQEIKEEKVRVDQ